jgi:protein-S-isoprenylcysteine O-methyltransferase Ste14
LEGANLRERTSRPEHFSAKRAPLWRRDCVKTTGTAAVEFPDSSKTGTDPGGDMMIDQAGTNNARSNSVTAFFRAFERTKLYDFLAATPLIAWYGFVLTMQLPPLAHQIASLDPATANASVLAGLVSKLATQFFVMVLVLLMVVRRQPLGKASGFYPRFAAVAGTFLSIAIVLLPARDLSVSLYVASTLLILGGIVFALYAVCQLGRSLSMMPEARRLVTNGLYSVIRHPLYLGEAVALVGVTLQYLSPWALALLALQCMFQLERMKNEELVLSRAFPDYRDYVERTARLVPGLY